MKVHQMKRTGRNSLSKHCHPFLRENVCFLKRSARAQLDYVMKCISHNGCWP
jgi:hypothetical protein